MNKCFRWRRGIRLVEILLSSLICCTMLEAQVTIKEKVSINPKIDPQVVKGHGLKTASSILSGFVMQKKGHILVQYDEALRAISQITTNCLLKIDVHHQPDTLLTDVVQYRFEHLSGTFPTDCGLYPVVETVS